LKQKEEKTKNEKAIEKLKNDKKLAKLKRKDRIMEEKIRRKWPHVKTMADLPKLGAFITFNRTS